MSAPMKQVIHRTCRRILQNKQQLCRRTSSCVRWQCTLPQQERKWLLHSAVCLERFPVVSPELHPLERKFFDQFQDLEVNLSLLSDHELQHQEDIERLARKDTLSEEELELLRNTAKDKEDKWNVEYRSFKPADRVTEADKTNNLHSPERKLDRKLILLVKQKFGSQENWVLPQGSLEQGESMREAAERVLGSHCGGEVDATFIGHAPAGFYKYKLPSDQSDAFGVKVFFYKAWYKKGDFTTSGDILDYKWVTKDELAEYVEGKYLDALSDFITEY